MIIRYLKSVECRSRPQGNPNYAKVSIGSITSNDGRSSRTASTPPATSPSSTEDQSSPEASELGLWFKDYQSVPATRVFKPLQKSGQHLWEVRVIVEASKPSLIARLGCSHQADRFMNPCCINAVYVAFCFCSNLNPQCRSRHRLMRPGQSPKKTWLEHGGDSPCRGRDGSLVERMWK